MGKNTFYTFYDVCADTSVVCVRTKRTLGSEQI